MICLLTKHLGVLRNSLKHVCAFQIELDYESVRFWREGKTGASGEIPTINSTHRWPQRRHLNPGHNGEKRVLSPLCHPCGWERCKVGILASNVTGVELWLNWTRCHQPYTTPYWKRGYAQCTRHQSRTSLLVSIEIFLPIEQRQSEEFRTVAVDETYCLCTVNQSKLKRF